MTTNEDVAQLAALECEIVEGDLWVQAEEVDSLNQLDSIREIVGNFLTEESQDSGSKLASLNLPALQIVSGDLAFQALSSPESLRLPALESVGGRFSINNNGPLTSIQMDALTTVGELLIIANSSLVTLNGLPSLTEGLLGVRANPELPQCEVDAIADRVGGCSSCTGNDRQAVCE